MIVFKTEVEIKNVSPEQITDFMIDCTDEKYSRWWPGVHIAFHTIKRKPGNIGNLVYFDEFVDRRRLKFKATVEEYERGKIICWRMVKMIPLPAYLTIETEKWEGGTKLVHTLAIGFNGMFRFLNPMIKFFIPSGMEKELDEHAKIEFPALTGLLAGGK